MRILILLLCLVSCSHREFEMEEMAKDVIKSKSGIEIDVKPLPKSQ
jgi:hypothetical protein